MLAVFNRFVAKKIPEAMKIPNSNPISNPTYNIAANTFLDYYPHAVTINFGESCFLSIVDCPKRSMIASQEDVFCLFTGELVNTDDIRKDLKLNNTASDPHIITQMYKMSKRKGEHMINSSLSEARGSFAFILYDSTCDFVAVGLDVDGSQKMYWGTDFNDNVIFTNFLPMAVNRCNRSYAPFPAGCLYTSTDGLMKFKHPLSKLEPVPWNDNEGNVRGVTFKIQDEIRGKYQCNDPKANKDTESAEV